MADEEQTLKDREYDLHGTIDRASQAQALLENDLLKEAFKAIEDKVMASWRTSGSVEEREERHRQLHTLDAVRMALESHVKTGKLAVKELEDVKVRRNFLKNNIRRLRA